MLAAGWVPKKLGMYPSLLEESVFFLSASCLLIVRVLGEIASKLLKWTWLQMFS